MELKDFIRDVLGAIVMGIKEAGPVASENGAMVNPRQRVTEETWDEGPKTYTQVDTQHIEFDVAVTVEHADNRDAGGKISVMGVGVGGKLEATSRNSSVSRVKFSLPVVLPTVGSIK